MTERKAVKRQKAGAPPEPRTCLEAVVRAARAELAAAKVQTWPSRKWFDDPEGFAREVLGVTFIDWQHDAAEEIRACVRAGRTLRIAIASGHKVGKTCFVICVALWYYCTHRRGRVVMTATTDNQVRKTLWGELRRRVFEALISVDGDLALTPRGGLVSEKVLEDGTFAQRGVFGFTAREAEGMAGFSGEAQLFIVDEASGVEQYVYDALYGNSIGGVDMILTGNPTRNEGEHFEAFHGHKAVYYARHVSSEDVAKEVEAKIARGELRTKEGDPVRGMCDSSAIALYRTMYGEESAEYKIRVKGEFALAEERKIIPIQWIYSAQNRWRDLFEPAPDGPGGLFETERQARVSALEGRLQVGVDVAGEAKEGDEWAFCFRRGSAVLEPIYAKAGLTHDSALAVLMSGLTRHRRPGEVPIVAVDAGGGDGARFGGRLLSMQEQDDTLFEAWLVQSAHHAQRWPNEYVLVRDELWAVLEAWIKEGAIPEDAKLAKELHFPEWKRATRKDHDVKSCWPPKSDWRKQPPLGMGRSPDRADALALSVWPPPFASDHAVVEANAYEDAGGRPWPVPAGNIGAPGGSNWHLL